MAGKKKTSKSQGKNKFINKPKSLGLFDHIKHIQNVQDPNYFSNLTEDDKKTFSHFMILRAISMNPEHADLTSFLFRYFDKIPSPQFYKLLIALIPVFRKFYPWVKSKKKVNKEVVEILSKKFEVSTKEAEDYMNILSKDPEKIELVDICRGFGINEKDTKKLLKEKVV